MIKPAERRVLVDEMGNIGFQVVGAWRRFGVTCYVALQATVRRCW